MELEPNQPLYRVVINDEEQYSIWTAERTPPAGWRAAGDAATRQECLDWIEQNWTEILPLSVRRALKSSALEQQRES